jgi:multidrug efflux pump subunit AcrA (membrane-fusion protein)
MSREPVTAASPVQRRWPRFRVAVPAVVEFPGTTDARSAAVAGSTRDLSAGGVYVVSMEKIVAGARVRASVLLGRLGRTFVTTGSIVRTEEYGFAVQFDEPVADAMDLPASTC